MIRFCTVGTSAITDRFVEAVDSVPGARIEAVHSRHEASAVAGAERWGGTPVWGGLATTLQSPDIDAVYIASPNAAHGEQVRIALDAGKHVLVEKPATPTSAEWDELVALAEDRGLVLIEAMRTAYDPGTAFVRSVLPQLGTLRTATLRFQKRSSRYDDVLAGERVNMFDPELAGGALNDLGVYCVRAMLELFGIPDSVEGVLVDVASGVDGAGQLLALYPGLVVGLDFSKITTTSQPSEIQGEDATLTIDHISSPRSLHLVRRDGTEETLVLDEPGHTLDHEVERFVELVDDGVDATLDQSATRDTLLLLERIRRTARHV